MNEVKLRNELKVFHGTSRYYKHMFPGKSPILLTDGCKYVKDEFKANWLFDAILSYQDEPILKKIYFQIWELQRLKKDLTWLLTCKEDINKKVLISQSIEFSDFPLDYFKMWLIGSVALLPSEY
jgi:hypothetical protein